MVFTIDRFCPLDKPLRCIVWQVSPGFLLDPFLPLSLLCVHCSDLWPLCLCLQITSEVHLFSHTKGKRHQQAVRDSSSIQGRELSDEEVVRTSLTPSLENKHSLPLYYCSRRVKKERTLHLSFMTRPLLLFLHSSILPPPCCRHCLIANGPWHSHCHGSVPQQRGDITPLTPGGFCCEAPFHRKAAR